MGFLPLVVVATCFAVVVGPLRAAEHGDFLYSTDGTNVTITGYKRPPLTVDVDIPSLIDGLPVTQIGESAFSSRGDLVRIAIPTGVTSIAESAFSSCTGLSNLTIPSSVSHIGRNAFWGCDRLADILVDPASAFFASFGGVLYSKDLSQLIDFPYGRGGEFTIPETVTRIGDYAFFDRYHLTNIILSTNLRSLGSFSLGGCGGITNLFIPQGVTNIADDAFIYSSELAAISVDDANSFYSSVDGVLFNKSRRTLVYFPKGRTGRYEIPVGTSSIGGYAFENSKLDTIVLPSRLEWIGNSAFSRCKAFSAIEFPETVTSIGDGAFSLCDQLVHLTFPTQLAHLGIAAFSDCDGLTSISIPGSLNAIGAGAFWHCSGLTNVAIASGVANLEGDAFGYCYGLTKVFLPSSIVSIGPTAFASCTSLKTLAIPEGVTNIGESAFSRCSQLSTMTVPKRVTYISAKTFEFCPSLEAVKIDGEVTGIGESAFSGCSRLSTIEMPPTITGLGDFAFASCTSLRSVIIPSGVTNIGWGVFYGCSGLSGVAIQNGVTNIGPSAFAECHFLTNLAIPGSVLRVGDHAFSECNYLQRLSISNGVQSLGDYAFGGCEGLAEVTLPASLVSLSHRSFAGCSRLKTLSINTANATYCSLDGIVFDKAKSTLVLCPEGKTGTYAVPSGVKRIGAWSFVGCKGLTQITLPDSIVEMGESAFNGCGLTTFSIPSGVTTLELGTFAGCRNLTRVTIPNTVTNIGQAAFASTALRGTLTIPSSVVAIGNYAFEGVDLKDLCFLGDAPQLGEQPFSFTTLLVYYLPGTQGWTDPFAGRPAKLWDPVILTDSPGFGVGVEGFGFNIESSTNLTVVIEATTDLARPQWVAVGSRSLNGSQTLFSDRVWTNYPARFYRLRSP